jgi:tRNA1Val (adenine37-N6)-methyltransferase
MKGFLMANDYFNFKQFSINQDRAAFKVGTDSVLLGASTELTGVTRILDIGSGTGVIAIMLAQRCNAEIVAIEPDYESYSQCLENVGKCKWGERIRVENMKLQDYKPDVKFDLIVTNPPYFSDSLKNPDPRKSASRHNDLYSNDELLKGALRLMAEGGRLQVIMPYVEGNIFIAEAPAYGLFCDSILKIRPLPTSEIRRMILTFSRQKLRTTEKFLTIEQGKRHEFTGEYINLTKDFYLKF